MDLRMVARGAPWMLDDERKMVKQLAGRLRRMFESRGVADTPLVALRAEDLCISLLLAKRADRALGLVVFADGAVDGAKSTGDRGALAAIEGAGRARERLRKAMKELEDACAKMGTPVDTGVADMLKPLLKRGAGVAEEAIRPNPAAMPREEEADEPG